MTFCSVPDFDENGLLPEGIYDCDLKVLQCRFVDSFPDSPSRPRLYVAFVEWMTEATKLVPSATEWIDGSYVTAKDAPDDIDVLTLCDAGFLTTLSGDEELRVEMHLNNHTSSEKSSVHTMLIGVYPEGDPQYPLFRAEIRIIGKWGFGFLWNKRAGTAWRTDLPKGFLRMSLGDKSSAPEVEING